VGISSAIGVLDVAFIRLISSQPLQFDNLQLRLRHLLSHNEMKLSIICSGVSALLFTLLTLPSMVTSIAVPFGMQAGGRPTFYDAG
jgi:hypothetical protein